MEKLKLTYNNLRVFLSSTILTFDPLKDIQQKLSSWSLFASSYAKDNPIFSVKAQNNDGEGIDVNIPYLGSISLDVLLFSSSAILSRVLMFWRSRREQEQQRQASDRLLSHTKIEDDGDDYNGTVERSRQLQQDINQSSPVKVRVTKGFKDEGLHKTINTMQDVKKSLRKVADPEMTRKEKLKILKQQNIRRSISGQKDGRKDGYLGMSPDSLQDARKFLKEVVSDETML